MENKRLDEKIDFKDLKQFHPEPSEEAIMTHNVMVLKNNITALKFIKKDILTKTEQNDLAEKLNDEWVKTVVEPYCKSLYDFCKKYEIAVAKSDISLCGQSFLSYLTEEMTDNSFLGKLKRIFEDED